MHLLKVESEEQIPLSHLHTPIGKLLRYQNMEQPFATHSNAELLIGMCMDNRKQLRIPENFAYIIRTGGGNLRYSEFKVSYAISIGDVRYVALIAHDHCGMVGLISRKEQFIDGLCRNAGWERQRAEEHFLNYAPMFEIDNELEFVWEESRRPFQEISRDNDYPSPLYLDRQQAEPYHRVTLRLGLLSRRNMAFLTIDQNKCKRDGICSAACPAGLIMQRDNASFPTSIPFASRACLRCGHCVAMCPYGALSNTFVTPEQCAPIHRDWLLTPEQTEHFLRFRRSIRTYEPDCIDRETLTRLIETARYAPSGHNSQPIQWLIIYEPTEVRRIAGLIADWMRAMIKQQPDFANAMHLSRVIEKWENGQDPICRQAPHIIVAHAPKDNPFAPAASTLALGYLELAAPSFGLGACWSGYFTMAVSHWTPLQDVLALPVGHACLGALLVGTPKYPYYRLPSRKNPDITWR